MWLAIRCRGMYDDYFEDVVAITETFELAQEVCFRDMAFIVANENTFRDRFEIKEPLFDQDDHEMVVLPQSFGMRWHKDDVIGDYRSCEACGAGLDNLRYHLEERGVIRGAYDLPKWSELKYHLEIEVGCVLESRRIVSEARDAAGEVR